MVRAFVHHRGEYGTTPGEAKKFDGFWLTVTLLTMKIVDTVPSLNSLKPETIFISLDMEGL